MQNYSWATQTAFSDTRSRLCSVFQQFLTEAQGCLDLPHSIYPKNINLCCFFVFLLATHNCIGKGTFNCTLPTSKPFIKKRRRKLQKPLFACHMLFPVLREFVKDVSTTSAKESIYRCSLSIWALFPPACISQTKERGAALLLFWGAVRVYF